MLCGKLLGPDITYHDRKKAVNVKISILKTSVYAITPQLRLVMERSPAGCHSNAASAVYSTYSTLTCPTKAYETDR